LNKFLKNSKYFSKTAKIFKLSICCFIPLQKRVIYGKIHFITSSNNILFIDFGLNYEAEFFFKELKLRIPNTFSLTKTCFFLKNVSFFEFKIVLLATFFLSKVLIERKTHTVDLKFFYFLFFSQQKYKQKRYYMKGRFLNFVKGGFSVSASGFISFLPLSHKRFKQFGKISCFYILSVDTENRTFVVSQAKVDSFLQKQLKRFRSKLLTKW
jgi:hypothetical protein